MNIKGPFIVGKCVFKVTEDVGRFLKSGPDIFGSLGNLYHRW
jgi:hypothetical protein